MYCLVSPDIPPKRRAVVICKVWLRDVPWDWPAHLERGDVVRVARAGLRDVHGHRVLPAVLLWVPMVHWQKQSCYSSHGSGDTPWAPRTCQL